MIDIVKSLRARNEFVAQTAADEIESLRQRVKVLETELRDSLIQERYECDRADVANSELATLKQAQEPVAWALPRENGDGFWLVELASEHTGHSKHSYWVPLAATPTIPEGWQLVPIKPTAKMEECGKLNGEFKRGEDANEVYSVMLSAAPKPGEPA